MLETYARHTGLHVQLVSLKPRLISESSWWMAKFGTEFWRKCAGGYKPSESCKGISSSPLSAFLTCLWLLAPQCHCEAQNHVHWSLWQQNVMCRTRSHRWTAQSIFGCGRGSGKGAEDKGGMRSIRRSGQRKKPLGEGCRASGGRCGRVDLDEADSSKCQNFLLEFIGVREKGLR